MMNLVFCQHEGCNKQYLFMAPLHVSLSEGARVVVDTVHGQKDATCSTDSFYVEDEAAKSIAKGCGGFFPLKPVIGKSIMVWQCQTFEDLPF